MLGSSLTLAILGLGSVQALPASTSERVTERSPQGWFGLGPPSTSFNPGDGTLPIDRCNWRENPFCLIPPGSSFKPGKEKRQEFDIPRGGDLKEVIAELERRLQWLQNKDDKTREDRREIRDLREALRHIAGVTQIIAPPGTTTTLTPGKRQSDMMKAIRELQLELVNLQNKSDPTDDDIQHIKDLQAMIAYTLNIGSISAPPGSGTSFTIGKRDADADFDITALEQAHSVLSAALSNSQPSHATALALQEMEAALAQYGSTQLSKRQSGDTFTLGNKACEQLEIMALKIALAGLQAAYTRDNMPSNIFLIEQLIASALALCKVETTFTPGTTIPGGPLKPDHPQPGGPIVPDRPQQGGPIVPDRPSNGGPVKPSD